MSSSARLDAVFRARRTLPGLCPGGGKRTRDGNNERESDLARGAVRKYVRCPKCGRRLLEAYVLEHDGYVQDDRASHFFLPPHKPRAHRSKAPRRIGRVAPRPRR